MFKDKFKIAAVILGAIIIVNFVLQVWSMRADIFKHFDSGYWTIRYKESQWVVPNSKNPIGDDGLYMYAGYRYMQGDDPTLLNAEIPPLGKYLIGFLEIYSGYIGIFSVVFSGLSLILLFLLNRIFFKSSFFALIPVAIFSFEPLFISQIRAPFLDTLYLSFFLLGAMLFLKNKYLLSGLSFGAFMAVKSPFLIAVVYAAVLLFMLVVRQFSWKNIAKMLIATLAVFLLSYTSTFLHGHSLLYLLKVQKYVIHFYASGAKAVFGSVFPMILLGKWYNWFGPVQQISEWTFLWAFGLAGTLGSIVIWLKKRDNLVFFQLLWGGLYLAFLSITPIFSRYLLLLLPFMYNLTIWSLYELIKKKSS